MNARHFHKISISSVRRFITGSRHIEGRPNHHGLRPSTEGKGLLQQQLQQQRSTVSWSVLQRSRGSTARHYPAVGSISCGFHQTRTLTTYEDRSSSGSTKTQRPQSQTTIDEEEINKFSRLSGLWWNESGEFEPLHALNELRVPLIRDALVSSKRLDEYQVTKPLDGFWIMDVGSGGGILSEPLARLGASVIGLEASEESIKIAQTHLIDDPSIREQVRYVHGTVEEVAESEAGKFDAVVVSEVLEHVNDARMFVNCACKLVRPGGSIIFTTLNKTRLAYFLGIVAAEQFLRIVPAGTHDWEKFVPPEDLQDMLAKNNFTTRLIHGMCYNPLSKRWSWVKDTSVNYALHAVKSPTADGQESNVWETQSSQN